MARTSAPPSDLEIEDPDGRSPGSGPSQRPTLKRSRLLLIIAVVAAVLAVAFPFRSQFNRSEAGRLQRRWIEAISLDRARSGDLTAINIAGAPGDGAQVHATAAGLYDQEAAALDSIRRSVHGEVIVDSGLRRLRSAMSQALTRQAADLRSAGRRWSASRAGGPSSYLDRQPDTSAAIQSVDDLLAGQARRFSLPARQPRPAPHFPAADATIASFQRFLDQPSGVTLLADTSDGLQIIDIDHSAIRPALVAGLPAGVEDLVVVRPDLMVLQHPTADGRQSSFYAVPARLPASAVSIGTGGQVIAGADPSTFWIITAEDTAVEVDQRGAVLAGAVPLPPNRFAVASTATGLVLQPRLQSDRSLVAQPIETWDPLGRQPLRTITAGGLGVLAADASTVAWVSGDFAIHLTDALSGADRRVPTPGYIPDLSGAALSPDGTRLAVTMQTPNGTRTVPAVIEVGTGVVHLGGSDEFPPGQPGPIAWTADSDRMFVPMNSATASDQLLTYRPGDDGPHYLRLPRAGHANVFAVVPVATAG
jgi:hypothetical protein